MNKKAAHGCLLLALLLLSVVGVVGCTPGLKTPGLPQQTTPYFRPPTPPGSELQPPKATETLLAAPAAANQPGGATQTLTCRDNLSFLSDVTIPDGTEVEAELTLDKRWEVENNGNCNWQENYRLRLIAGPDLGAQTEQALYPARSGSSAVLRVVFKAPTEPGTYKSAWQAINPQGDPFGDPFYIEIVVK